MLHGLIALTLKHQIMEDSAFVLYCSKKTLITKNELDFCEAASDYLCCLKQSECDARSI